MHSPAPSNSTTPCRAHLQHLAHPARPARRQTRAVQRVRPTVHPMLDAWTGQPAFVLGRHGDVLATNALARALLADFDAATVDGSAAPC
jgi:hypothetical protein